MLLAKEAVECGFANGMLKGADLGKTDWFDPMKVPCISTLLKSDMRTLQNAKQLINFSKDNAKIEAVIDQEAKFLVNTWLEDDFPEKFATFMMMLAEKREQAKAAAAKAKAKL